MCSRIHKNLIALSVAASIVGCTQQVWYKPEDYGYHYTDVTSLGIMYRIDGAGVDLDPGLLDYYFTSTLNCVGSTTNTDPSSLLVISTDQDTVPNRDSTNGIEAHVWRAKGNKPALTALNSTVYPSRRYELLSHELVHIFVNRDDHNHEAFERCGWRRY